LKKIRAFIAIPLPAVIHSYLKQLVGEYRSLCDEGSVRWVKTENIHLTLRFLGDADVNALPDLYEELDRVAAAIPAFTIRLGKLGCFPNQKRPRVIWIGVDSDSTWLLTLQESIEQSVRSLGWKSENRKFHPHLTLGRVKNSHSVRQAEIPWSEAVAAKKYNVSEVNVYESKLQPSGAVYSLRHSSNLLGGDLE
jgi:2'-5' RNA ligase